MNGGHTGSSKVRLGHASGQCSSPERQPHETGHTYESGLTGYHEPCSMHRLMLKDRANQKSVNTTNSEQMRDASSSCNG